MFCMNHKMNYSNFQTYIRIINFYYVPMLKILYIVQY